MKSRIALAAVIAFAVFAPVANAATTAPVVKPAITAPAKSVVAVKAKVHHHMKKAHKKVAVMKAK
jgi:hypothetical protein